jgi:hypothetical protein
MFPVFFAKPLGLGDRLVGTFKERVSYPGSISAVAIRAKSAIRSCWTLFGLSGASQKAFALDARRCGPGPPCGASSLVGEAIFK